MGRAILFIAIVVAIALAVLTVAIVRHRRRKNRELTHRNWEALKSIRRIDVAHDQQTANAVDPITIALLDDMEQVLIEFHSVALKSPGARKTHRAATETLNKIRAIVNRGGLLIIDDDGDQFVRTVQRELDDLTHRLEKSA